MHAVVRGVTAAMAGVVFCGVGIDGSIARASAAGSGSVSSSVGASVGVPSAVGAGSFAGDLDSRTGALSGLVAVGGGLTLGWNQQAVAGAQGAGRAGVGAGWGWAMSFVDVPRGLVFPGTGGQYARDAGTPSGMRDYVGGGLSFRAESGVLPGREGVIGDDGQTGTERRYELRLSHADSGVEEYLSARGDLVASVDRFGARTDFVWDSGVAHRLLRTVDGLGATTELQWSSSQLVVKAPASSVTGVAPETVIGLSSGRVQSVTDATGQVTTFGYAPVSGGAGQYLTTLTAPTKLVTTISYQRLAYQNQVVAVSRIETKDPSTGARVGALRELSMDPSGNSRRNYTGYTPSGAKDLFGTGSDYRYSTRLSDGSIAVTRTWNSNHLLVDQVTEVIGGPIRGVVVSAHQSYEQGASGKPLTRPELKANWAKPRQVQTTVTNPVTGATKASSVSAEYDELGRVTVSDNGTVRTETEYGAFSQPVKTVSKGVDGLVQKKQNTLSADGKTVVETVVSSTPSGGGDLQVTSHQKFGYDNTNPVFAGQPTTVTEVSANGQEERTTQVTMQVPGDGTVVRTFTDPAQVSTTVVDDIATGLTVKQVDSAGRQMTFGYDKSGRQTSTTGPDGQTVTTTYVSTATGGQINATVSTHADGYVTRTVFDNAGQQIATQDNYRPSQGQVSQVDPGSPQDADGWRTLSTALLDEQGRVVEATDQAGRTTTTEYDVAGQPIKVSNTAGVVESTYDAVAGMQTQTLTPHGSGVSIITTSRVDDRGNQTGTTRTFSDGTAEESSSTTFDSADRPLKQTGSGSAPVDMVYDAQGTPTVALSGHDPADAVTSTTQTTAFAEPVKKTLAQHNSSVAAQTLGYDDAGRVVSETDQTGAVWTNGFGADGTAETQVRPDGSTAHVVRDSAGRAHQTYITPAGADADDTAARTEWVQSEYDKVTGRLTAMFNPSDRKATEIRWSYSPDGSPTSKTYPDGKSLSWVWADSGELSSFTDAAGVTTTYIYDSDTGRLQHAENKAADAVLAAVDYSYTPLGLPETITRGNGATTTYTYNQKTQVTKESHTDATGELITSVDYRYDAAGNIVRQVDTNGPANPAGASTTVITHTYDGNNRLVGTAVYANPADQENLAEPSSSSSYRYDLASQLTGSTETKDGKTTTTEYELDPAGRIQTVKVDGATATKKEYDANGSLTHDTGSGTRYEYNASSRTTSTETGTTTVANTYWVDGTLKSETTSTSGAADSTVTTYWNTETEDVPTLVNQAAGDGQIATYLFGLTRENRTILAGSADGQLAVVEDQTGAGYYHTNRQKSVVALTDNDGATTTSYSYTDYGIATASGTAGTVGGLHRNPLTYTGAYSTPTGTYQLGDRVYDPTTTTFTTRDHANTLARYAYGAGNPHLYSDPTGNAPQLSQSWINTIINLVVSIVAIAVEVVATIATGGLTAPLLVATIGMSVIGTGLGVVSTLNEHFAFMPQQVAEGLNWAGLALGVAAGVTATATGILSRTISKNITQFTKPKYNDFDLWGVASGGPISSMNKATTTVDTQSRLRNLAMKVDPTWQKDNSDRINRSGAFAFATDRQLRGKDTLVVTYPNVSMRDRVSMTYMESALVKNEKGQRTMSSWSPKLTRQQAYNQMNAEAPGTTFMIAKVTDPEPLSWFQKMKNAMSPDTIHRNYQDVRYLNGVTTPNLTKMPGYKSTEVVTVDAADFSNPAPFTSNKVYYHVMVTGTIPG